MLWPSQNFLLYKSTALIESCMESFKRYYAIKDKIQLSKGFWKKRDSNIPTEMRTRKCIIVVSYNIHLAYKFLCYFIQSKSVDIAIQRILVRNIIQPPYSKFYPQKLYQ